MGGPGSLRALRVAVLPEVRYTEKSKGYSPIFEIVGLSAWPRIREEGGMRGVPSFFRCPRARLSRTRAFHGISFTCFDGLSEGLEIKTVGRPGSIQEVPNSWRRRGFWP